MNIPIKRVPGKKGLYTIGNSKQKVHVRIVQGNVLIRVGGGWVNFVEFANRKYAKIELSKSHNEKKETNWGKNKSGVYYNAQARDEKGGSEPLRSTKIITTVTESGLYGKKRRNVTKVTEKMPAVRDNVVYRDKT